MDGRRECRGRREIRQLISVTVAIDFNYTALMKPGNSISRNMLTFRRLTRAQKSLDQLTLAANRHTGESLVPLALGHLRLAVEPLRQQF
jgi:hypothetical protein